MKLKVSYEFYKEYGGDASKTVFKKLQYEATQLIHRFTFNRISQFELSWDDEKAVHLAVCAVIDTMITYKPREGIASEDNDGYKVSYTTDKALYQRCYEVASIYLYPTTLLDRGVFYDYKH